MKHPIQGWLLGVFLLALASVSAAEPARAAHTQKPVQKHVQQHVQQHLQKDAKGHATKHAVAAAPAPAAPSVSLPAIAQRYEYPSPFERQYGAHLAKTTAATPGTPDGTDGAVDAAGNGARTPGAQVDSNGIPNQALHPQTPPLVTVGDWDFSADAHLPLARSHDTGAAISARHGF
ncbi:hypothetical protein [Paraburkholderia silvatlantica]|uniref:Uncharacterized protein n=1 Tax=Paraburkholderia silvatlantica TaxID=321895 RepID=A0ABR6FFZ0_9BURK|nr:hypothetical protein [Paraburkholderia silvatlantica]MBB2926330.1 hypothetical protein [Paraburkholderia silvatlantica]PVY26880.1 hypothetical protein C7411_122154 [Paraburkholderia silvatlantica]PXW33167.1 hypothetical protein C7413_121154 [Paraburkholderia silvatlantica]